VPVPRDRWPWASCQGDTAHDAANTYRSLFFLSLIPGVGSALVFGLTVREITQSPHDHLPRCAALRTLSLHD
jgi:hypothetical protein